MKLQLLGPVPLQSTSATTHGYRSVFDLDQLIYVTHHGGRFAWSRVPVFVRMTNTKTSGCQALYVWEHAVD